MAKIGNKYLDKMSNDTIEVVGFTRKNYGMYALCKRTGGEQWYISADLLDDPNQVFYKPIQ